MATVSIYYDMRYKSVSGKYPLYYRVNLPGRRNFNIKTGLSIPEEWWDGYEVVKAPQRDKMNRILRVGRTNVEEALLTVQLSVGLQLTTSEIRARVQAQLDGCEYKDPDAMTFGKFFAQFIDRKDRENTANTYRHTLSKINRFAEVSGWTGDWSFEDITLDWLNRFERYLKTQHLDSKGKAIEGVRQLKTNGIAIHFRNIRAVVNAAIDEELTTLYPFRRFKIKQEETAKRSLSVEALRTLRDYECEPHQRKYRDLFLLTFYLLGINPIDLFSLTEIIDGRIEYRRSKTGHLFSIKVEPEAQEIINRYRGEKHLLDVLDTYRDYKDFAHRMNNNLKSIGTVERKGLGGKKHRVPLFPNLSIYWARHTWATIAAELDIPDETISMALGHSSGNRVTNIYINRNRKKVDEANRKVIDFISKKMQAIPEQ
jgi:integrase|nr:MAG TPA: Integrase [Caudoviricetes sp.]